jgi:hypothetical protein
LTHGHDETLRLPEKSRLRLEICQILSRCRGD